MLLGQAYRPSVGLQAQHCNNIADRLCNLGTLGQCRKRGLSAEVPPDLPAPDGHGHAQRPMVLVCQKPFDETVGPLNMPLATRYVGQGCRNLLEGMQITVACTLYEGIKLLP